MSHEYVMVLTTLPVDADGPGFARSLVDERLAACVNLVPQIRSIYRWKDAIQDETETLAIAKTTSDRAEALHARLIELHPYQLPEVLALPVSGGHAPYLEWVGASVAD